MIEDKNTVVGSILESLDNLKNSKENKKDDYSGTKFGSSSVTNISLDYDEAIDEGLVDTSVEGIENFTRAKNERERIELEKTKDALKNIEEIKNSREQEKIDEVIQDLRKTDLEKIAKEILNEVEYKTLKELKRGKEELLDNFPTNESSIKHKAKTITDKDRAWYEWEEVLGDYLTAGALNTVAMFTPTTSGLSKENADKLNDYNARIDVLQNKAIEEGQRRLHEIQEGLASDYLSAKKEAGRYSVPTGMNTYGTIVGKSDFLKHKAFLVNEQLIDDMNIKLNDGDFWSLNMGRKFNPHHFGLGISELVDDLTVYMPLLYKANKGEEELSDGEKSLMESLARKSGYEQSGELSPNGYITKATTGFVDSFSFMSQMIFTRGIGAGASTAKAILNQSVKQGIKKGVGKVAAQLGKSIVQTAAMPGTYSAMMDKYTGVIEKGVDEKGKDVFYMRESLYKKYKDDLMVWKKADVIKRKELLNLNSEGKLTKTQIKELEDLNYKLGHSAENPNFAMSYDEILSAVKPKSFLKSVGQGYAQNFNEVISELYGGKIIGKMLPKLKNPFFKSKIDQLSSNNKVSRLNNFANKSKPIRDLAGIGGIKEEYFEELFVAPLNAISEGSMQEIEMLLDPNYHLEILGQVAVTGGIMRAAGVPISALMNGRGNVSAKTLKEEAAKREAEAEAIGRLSIEDEERIEGLNELSDFIDLSANNSTIRTGDFNTRIRQLTNERKFDQADQLLGKLFDQLSFKAITTGTSVEYREQLDKLLKNEGGVELQPAFIAAIENSKKELTKLEKVREENIDHPELNKILEATQASMRADKVVKKADKTLQDNADNVRKAIDAKVKGTEFEGIIYDPTKILGGLDEIENEEESEKYKRFLSFIQEEADFRVTGSIVAESIKSAAFNTKSKVEELKNNTLSKEEETAQNKTYVQEYLKELQKLEVERIENNEENTDASFNAILNKVNSKLTNIPNDLKTKLGLKLKITRQKKIKDEQIKQQEAANKILAAEKALRDQEEGVQSLKDNRTQDEKDAENLIDAFSNTGNQPTGNRSLIVDADTDEALPVGDSSQADKNARKNSIFSLYNLFEKLNGRVPTFKEMVQKFYDKDRANAERVFLGIREAWEANEYKGVEYDKIYEEFFPDILELENTAFDAFNFTFGAEVKEPTREETNEKAEQEIKKIEEEASETESFDENGLPVKSIATNRTSSPATRLGFLALNYEEKIEDGIFKKLVKGGKLRISKVLNYFDLINPNKNNVGDRLGIEVSTEVDWDQIRVLNDSPNNPYSRNSKGKTLTIFFSDWLKKKEETWDSVRKDTDPVNFRDSQEFKNKVPMFTIGLEDGSRKAFIHETAWYNPFNVLVSYSQEVGAGNAGVDTENVTESQKDAIEEGKINHQNLRNRIIENEKTSPGTSQVEILEKHEGPFDVIPLSEPLIKVQESNPDSMIGLQLGTNTSLNISSSAMFTNQRNEDGSKRVIVNEEELKKDGHKTWMISHIDTIKDKDGTVTKRYRAFRTHNLNDEGKQGVKSESLNTVRFAYAVYAILNKGNSTMANAMYDSHVKDTEYDLTLEQAKEYAKKVLELTKVFNIEDFNSFTDFSRIYLNSKKDHADHLKRVREAKEDPKKKYDKRSAPYQAENLFNSNSTDFWANTAKEELDKTDRPVVKITKEGGVEKKSDNYVAYLKDILTVNVKSHNVGTNEDPVYATSLQPSIVYDLIAEKAPVPKVKEQAVKDAKEQVESLEKKIEETTSPVAPTETIKEFPVPVEKTEVEKAEDMIETLNAWLEGQGFSVTTEDDLFTDQDIINMSDTSQMKDMFKTVEGLTYDQETGVVDYIYRLFLQDVILKTTGSFQSLKNNKKNDVIAVMDSKKEIITKYLKTLKEVDAKLKAEGKQPNTKITVGILNLTKSLVTINSIGNNWEVLADKALAILEKKHDTKNREDEDNKIDDTLYIKDNNKTSFEEISKLKASKELRRMFENIKQLDSDGNVVTGFLGLEKRMNSDDVYNTLAQILMSGFGVTSNYKDVKDKLKTHQETSPWITELLKELDGGSQQLRNQFIYNIVRHGMTMKFGMVSNDQDGLNYKVFDTNANEIKKIILNNWAINFRSSKLLDSENKIDKNKAKNLLLKLENLGEDLSKVDLELVKDWISNFGIELSDGVWKDLKNNKVTNNSRPMPFNSFLHEKNGLILNLKKYLEYIQNVEDTHIEADKFNHPFSDISGVLKVLANAEAKHHMAFISTSFRDNKKNISGLIAPSYSTDRVSELKRAMLQRLKIDDISGMTTSDIINHLRNTSFSKHSIILDALEKDLTFAGKFGVSHVGLTALKELGKKASEFAGVTDLNSLDYDVLAFIGFQDTQQETVEFDDDVTGITKRVARMFLPTMSDKSQMLQLTGIAYNFFKDFKKSFSGEIEDKEYKLSSQVRELLYKQIILPELTRIVDYTSKGIGNKVNIKDYDKGARRFNLLPSLNNVVGKENDIAIRNYFGGISTEDINLKEVERIYKESLTDALEKNIHNQVGKQMEEWKGSVAVYNDQGKVVSLKFDSKYLKQLDGDLDSKFKAATYDFIMNNMLSYNEMFKVLAGDPAQYSKDAAFKIGDETYDPSELDATLEDVVSKRVGVNIGKRLALLIAPGLRIANAHGEKYQQIFLDDQVGMAENMEYMITARYGAKVYNKLQKKLVALGNAKGLKRKLILLEIKATKSIPLLMPFLDIESTDAQEYTTLDEHIHILINQGRLDDEKAEQVQKLLALQRRLKNPQYYLSKEEVDLVLQPIKPVYTGQSYEPENGLMRTIYIKSSSFPLIPQLTKGTNLDPLRVKMESLGSHVRASYQSANKVGAVKTPIDPFSKKGLDSIKLGVNMLILDRANFRIQQDIPTKNSNIVSMGTQIFKMLLGNDVLSKAKFIFKGENITGKQLYNKYNDTFAALLKNKRYELYKELGLDDQGGIRDKKFTVSKISELLKKEATKRGYSDSDLSSLEIVKIDMGDKSEYEFKIPIWLHPNGNKYESLLNSIISNRMMTIKMPGYSSVVGSESGFEYAERDKNGKIKGVDESRIIYLDGWNGKELQGVKTVKENGETTIQSAQVFVSSHFRDHTGKLIDLFKKDKNNNYIYLIKNKEGGLGLNTEMFDKELLESFTFRTPTSSHVSGSVVQIVGILPPESGDLMIVPKSFTKQKGLDFDVDKETTYQLNHTIDNDGRIRVLDQAYIDAKRDRLDSFIDKNMKVELDLIERQKGEIEMLLKDQGFSELEISMLQEETLNYKIKLETRKGREEIRDSLIHKLEGQLLENDFVRVHISIYKNPNKDIQNKINSVLSMEFAGEQADMIEKLEEFSNESSYNDFTILSHAYQKIKMTLGAVGKMAIGVYSNSVTFHAAATIAAQTGNPISLQQKVEDGSYEPMSFTLGGVTSDGVFGRIKALAGKVGDAVRDVSDVFGEKQNTATDNEKEQILGRVGINKHTIGVDSLLTELGFDKDKNGNSIPYFFLSQPIIKEYSKLMDDAFGITAKYNKNAEKDIIKQLAEKYGAEYNEEYVVDQSVFSPEAMLNGIQDKSDKSMQFDALMQFLEYKGIADNLAKKQSVLNTNNLGKSIIESNNTFDNLVDFKEAQFKNLEKTIGTFNRFKSYEAAMADDPSYVKVKDDLYIRPETPQGNIVVHGLTLAKNLWSDYFPYGDQAFEKLYKEFGKLDGEISEFKKITLKETIVKEFKKYIYSRKNNGLFSESSIIERSRLFINTKTNQAISNYLSEVTRKNTGEFKDGLKLLQSNALLNKFTYDINVDGTASTIKYNNTANDSFDEGPVEKALAQLIVENKKLPPKNGRPYNTKMLAQELINYAYLEGGVQEAVQFVTFIPVQYLDSLSINGVSVSENLRMIGSPSRVGNGSKGFEKVIGFTPDQDVSMFFRQFIQHFPEEATQFSESDLKKHIPAFKWANGRPTPTFSIENHPDGGPKFISIRNTKSRSKLKQDKWVLYERTHGEGSVNYVRRDTLGVHGMSEYQYMTLNAKTVLKGKSAYVETFIPLINVEFTPNEKKQYFGFNNDAKVADILDNIINSKIEGGEYLIIVAKLLKPFLNTETKVKVLDDIKDYRGFMRKKNTIVMSADFLQNNSPKEIANAFLHEYIHSVTSNEIEKYVSRNEETGTYNVKENAPESVFKLIKAFNQFSNTIPQSEKDALTDKLRRRGEGENVGAFNDREFVVYAATNIQEFMSASLTSETFMSHASKITIKDKKLSDIIKAIYQEFLVSLAGLVGNEATLASESIGLTLDFIREEGKKRIKEIDAHTLYNESDLSNETTKLPKPVNKSSTLTDEQKLNESLLEDDNKPATDQSLGTNDIENFIKTLKKKDCE
jgi:hypothetical protein